jgi:glycogen operon protein
MIAMGDEVRRTQGGNNSAYCLDDETSWFDWRLLETHADVRRFVTLLIERRALRDVAHEQRRLSLSAWLREADKTWHGVRLNEPDWSPHSHGVALGANLREDALQVHMILNAYWEALDYELPKLEQGPWRRWIDTSLDCPSDIVPWRDAVPIPAPSYRAGPRSVVVLIAAVD